jgi:hypothetical protein
MGEIEENTPKLKLKPTAPEEETVPETIPPLVSETATTPTVHDPAEKQVISAATTVCPPTMTIAEIEEGATKVKISISSIKSGHKIETPLSGETSSEENTTAVETNTTQGGENIILKPQSYERNDVAPSVTLQNALESIKETPKDGIFRNYASDFEKKSMSFMERVRSISRAPKTRIGFVLMVILIPVFGIGALMFLSPEKHSFSVYHANALYFYQTHFSTTLPQTIVPKIPEITATQNPAEWEKSETTPVQNREEIKQQKLREFLKSKQ